MLASLAEELTSSGARFQAVETRSSVRERLRGEGVDGRLGGIDRFTSVADALEAFQSQGQQGDRLRLVDYGKTGS